MSGHLKPNHTFEKTAKTGIKYYNTLINGGK